MDYQCRMCENKIPGEVAPLDGLCAKCHVFLCDKGLGKCVRCAKIVDGLVDFNFGKPINPYGKE